MKIISPEHPHIEHTSKSISLGIIFKVYVYTIRLSSHVYISRDENYLLVFRYAEHQYILITPSKSFALAQLKNIPKITYYRWLPKHVMCSSDSIFLHHFYTLEIGQMTIKPFSMCDECVW